MENLQKKPQRYVPLEISEGNIDLMGLDLSKACWKRVGNKPVKVVMVAVTEEVYQAYMRPWWRELKRQERHVEFSLDEEQDSSRSDLAESAETVVLRRLENEELYEAIASLNERDRTIVALFMEQFSEAKIAARVNMSQRGVGKRKARIFEQLREILSKKYKK